LRLSRPNPRVGRLSASATMWPDKWFSSTESGLQAAFVRSICKVGELESWEVGKLESWEVGKLESWRVGKWGSWRVGELESWEVGKLESWEVEKLEMQGWVSNPPVHGFAPIAPCQSPLARCFYFRLSTFDFQLSTQFRQELVPSTFYRGNFKPDPLFPGCRIPCRRRGAPVRRSRRHRDPPLPPVPLTA